MIKNSILCGIVAVVMSIGAPATSATVSKTAKTYEIAGISSDGSNSGWINYNPTTISFPKSGTTLATGVDGSGGGSWNTGSGKIKFQFSAVENVTGKENLLNISGYGKIKQTYGSDRVSGYLKLKITSADVPGAVTVIKVSYSDKVGTISGIAANGFDASNGILSLLGIGHAHFKYGSKSFGKHTRKLATLIRTDLQFVMASVPLPASLLLILSAFGGLAFVGSRRKSAVS